MQLDDISVIARNEKAAWQNVEDKTVVVTAETRKIHILYGAGCALWNFIEKPKNFVQIVENICGQYDVDMELAKNDIHMFINELLEKDIVKKQ